MENNKKYLTEFSAKVMPGLQKGLRKLAETSAAENRSLVVKINGEIKKVPAKDLLHTLPS
jgi:hypothetical protein